MRFERDKQLIFDIFIFGHLKSCTLAPSRSNMSGICDPPSGGWPYILDGWPLKYLFLAIK